MQSRVEAIGSTASESEDMTKRVMDKSTSPYMISVSYLTMCQSRPASCDPNRTMFILLSLDIIPMYILHYALMASVCKHLKPAIRGQPQTFCTNLA